MARKKLAASSARTSTSTRAFTDGYLEERGVKLAPEFELATSNILVQFARKGLGIACVVEDFVEEYLQTGELFRLERKAVFLANSYQTENCCFFLSNLEARRT